MTRLIFTALTNHLWQSTIFALAVVLVALAFRNNRAQVRYWLWLSASLKFLVPFALLISLGNFVSSALASHKAAAEVAAPALSLAVAQITQPFSNTLSSLAPATPHPTNWLSAVILAVWACGFLAVALMRLRGWLRIRAAVRASVPIDIAAPVEVRSSPGLLEPGIVGLFHSILLLPEGILQTLSPSQLEAVLAHELAHVRRRDNLTAAIHMLVEAIFWFYPLVWWIGARMVEERERACDEAVLSLGSQPRDYAESILTVCKFYRESPFACFSGITGSDIKRRIERIMRSQIGEALNSPRKMALVIAGALALACPLIVGILIVPSLRARSGNEPAASFEVASVKPDAVAAHYRGENIDIDQSGSYYVGSGLTPRYLIKYAYRLSSNDQLSGGPSWIDSDKYVINAKTDETLVAQWKGDRTLKDTIVRSEMRSLLQDRFQLKVSHRTKELPLFELVVAKGGSKLSSSTGNGNQHSNDGHNEGSVEVENMKNEPIQVLVDELARQPELAEHLVMDKTGLIGFYTFDWKWTRQKNNADPVADAGGTSSDPPSLWTALQEQLGLKLQSAKGPVDCIVIDQIERPTPN